MSTFSHSRKKVSFFNLALSEHSAQLLVLWAIFFCYSISVALIFQKLIVPITPSLHAVGGSLTNDASYFHSVAVTLADEIRINGWSHWKLFPNHNSSGHVSILAALYVVFGTDTSLAIPLNSVFHAFGGILIFLIAYEINQDKVVAKYAGVLSASAFALFPSALNWYGQIHKDAYLIVGSLLILLVWLRVWRAEANCKVFSQLFTYNIIGISLVASMRPSVLKILILILIVLLIIMLLTRIFPKSKSIWAFFLLTLLTLVVNISIVSASGGKELFGDGYVVSVSGGKGLSGDGYVWGENNKKWQWNKTELLPDFLDKQFETLASTRVALLSYGLDVKASSMIDTAVAPQSSVEIIEYVPRALQIAILAPFPNIWFDHFKVTKLFASFEMIVFYLSFIGLVFLIRYQFNYSICFVLLYALTFLSIYGVSISNIGTLYRLRYCYEMLLLLMGMSGWVLLLSKNKLLSRLINYFQIKHLETMDVEAISNIASSSGDISTNVHRKKAVNSAVVVMFLTFLGFLGFFIRDILMARTFGVGGEMDDFFIAMLIPVFLVNVVCMPFGSAIVTFLHEIKKNHKELLQSFISHFTFISSIYLFLVCGLLYLFLPNVLSGLHLVGYAKDLANITNLTFIALAILFLSGYVIIANSVHTVNEHYVLPAAAQLVVPIMAILFLELFGGYGTISVVLGMLIGQLTNLVIVQVKLKQQDLSLKLRYSNEAVSMMGAFWAQCFPFMIVALFLGVTLPIDTLLAANLGEGAVSSFSLGNKVVLFILGLLSAVMTSVLLPYFSFVISNYGKAGVRRELSFFLFLGTLLSIPVAITVYIYCDLITSIIFQDGLFNSKEAINVSHVMRYGIIQLPFWVSNIILLKYANATKHNKIIVFTALIGLALNILLSLILMPRMNISGISLAASIAVIVSSAILLIYATCMRQVSIIDSIITFINWLLFTALIISIHFASYSSIIIVVSTYLLLGLVYIQRVSNFSSGGTT